MTIALTLLQAEKRLALRAQLTNDLLQKVENIEEEYPKHVKELRETITSQAERIKELEAALAISKQEREEGGTALRGELAAERAKVVTLIEAHQRENEMLNSSHAAEIARLTEVVNYHVALVHVRDVTVQRLHNFINTRVKKLW